MAGFEWIYNIGGGRPLIQTFLPSGAETYHKGDLCNLESGLLDPAVTGNTEMLGAFQGAFDPVDEDQSGVVVAATTTRLKVITNPDAVYETVDNNARLAGAQLDITGTTGAQGLAASSNDEFTVVERKLQTADKTKVTINPTAHQFGSN